MPRVLVLFVDGTCEVRRARGLKGLQACVGGNIEDVITTRYYWSDNDERREFLCYANEDGRLRNLPANKWSPLLKTLGLFIPDNYGLLGDVVVMAEDEDGDEASVDPYIVKLCTDYIHCDDKDIFIAQLEERNANLTV